MRMTRKALAGLTAACIVCAPSAIAIASADAASAAKKLPSGTSYIAATTDGGMHIVVSPDRHQIRTALFAYKTKCSNGDMFYDYDRFESIPISANRKFTYRYDSGPLTDNSAPGATFSYTESFSGQLNNARTKIVGTARSTLAFNNPAGGSFTCDTGTVRFIAKD